MTKLPIYFINSEQPGISEQFRDTQKVPYQKLMVITTCLCFISLPYAWPLQNKSMRWEWGSSPWCYRQNPPSKLLLGGLRQLKFYSETSLMVLPVPSVWHDWINLNQCFRPESSNKKVLLMLTFVRANFSIHYLSFLPGSNMSKVRYYPMTMSKMWSNRYENHKRDFPGKFCMFPLFISG